MREAAQEDALINRTLENPTMLTDTSRGLWQISTLSGTTYILELDLRMVVRRGGLTRYSPSRFLRDGDPVPPVTLIQFEIGRSMILLIDPPGPCSRLPELLSTMVVEIEWSNAGEDS